MDEIIGGTALPQPRPQAPAKKRSRAKKAKQRAKAKARHAVRAPVAPDGPFSIGLSEPGGDVPDGARRMSCPACGAKHDVACSDIPSGQGGTWSVPMFRCVAGCGYTAVNQPVA